MGLGAKNDDKPKQKLKHTPHTQRMMRNPDVMLNPSCNFNSACVVSDYDDLNEDF